MGEQGIALHALLDAAPDAIVGVAQDGRIISVNTQAEALFGYSRHELVGELVEVLVPEAIRAQHPGFRERYLRDPRPRPMGVGIELAGRRKDGSEFPAEISLAATESDAGLVVFAAIRDVSDRLRADAMFRGLLEAAPDAMLCVDSDGAIRLANAQTEQLFGYARDELLGRPLEMLIPERARGVHPAHRAAYFANPRPRPIGARMQLAGRRRDGSEFPAEISLSAVQTDEGVLVSAAVRDVTDRLEEQAERARLKAEAERERLEAQLQQSQRLESLGQLAGGVAHDFNNLLGVILNYAAFVAEELAAAEAEEGANRWAPVRADVDEIARAGERATELTRQLLAFARREVVRPRVLDLNEVIDELERLLMRSLGEHVTLSTSLEPELWSVMADPGKLEQVLVNLAVNARDAMPGTGTLTIDTQNITADATYAAKHPDVQPGRYVRLRVSDTGVGMDPEVQRRAFEPFFTTKAGSEGTGLGLATVYGIITQAEGHVQIYSEPGMGTTIGILLPATDAAPDETRPSAPMNVGGAGETVLVVEDEDPMREVTCRILSRNGYHVVSAANGAEALDAARSAEHVDLVLTDVVMPLMLGKELAERIKEAHPGLPVIFMSGYAMPVLASSGRLDPRVTLIEKPYSAAVLLGHVRTALDATTATEADSR